MFVIIKIEHTFGGNNMKFKKLILCIITISIIFLVFIPHMSKANETVNSKYITITVCTGDTLWAIASDYLNQNTDIREFIYNIRKVNKLQSAMLTPGQKLLIPCD